MTTNSSESFNRVFTGVRSLPVSGIVEFSFQKCNEYFVKRWELAHRNLVEHGRFGKDTTEHLKEAEELAQQHTREPYGPLRHIFSVQGRGGTNMGGERYGGRNYRVDLEKVECSCNVPQIMHAPCSHMVTTYMIRGYDYTTLPYMSPCISILTPFIFGRRASSRTSTRHSGPLIMDLTTCPIRTCRSLGRVGGRRSDSRGTWTL
jgi:hypothetical protein